YPLRCGGHRRGLVGDLGQPGNPRPRRGCGVLALRRRRAAARDLALGGTAPAAVGAALAHGAARPPLALGVVGVGRSERAAADHAAHRAVGRAEIGGDLLRRQLLIVPLAPLVVALLLGLLG